MVHGQRLRRSAGLPLRGLHYRGDVPPEAVQVRRRDRERGGKVAREERVELPRGNREQAERRHAGLPEAFDARPNLTGGAAQREGVQHLVAHRARDLVEVTGVLEPATQVGRRVTEARDLGDAVVGRPASVDTSKPAIRGRGKTGHRAGAQAERGFSVLRVAAQERAAEADEHRGRSASPDASPLEHDLAVLGGYRDSGPPRPRRS